MAEYTPNYNLYKPNRLDNDPVDTTLAGNFASIDTEIKNRETEIDDHKASSMAHSSENITHGAVTVQDAIFELNSQIDVLVVNGDSSPEAAQARVKADGTTYTTLRDRLNDSDASLADIVTNVKLFGAKGDGVTDDTLAIQKAIDFISNQVVGSQSGGIIHLPLGDYLISSALIFSNKNIKIRGTGRLFTTSSINLIDVKSTASNIIIEEIKMQKTTTTGGAMIYFEAGASNILIQNCILQDNLGDFIYSLADNVTVRNNTISNGVGDSCGVVVVGTNNRVLENTISLCRVGVFCTSDSNGNGSNTLVRGNVITNCGTYVKEVDGAIVAYKTHDVTIVDNDIDLTMVSNVQINGIRSRTAYNMIINNNRVKGGANCISVNPYLGSAKYINISNNKCSSPVNYGIIVKGKAYHVTGSGNIIENSPNAGICCSTDTSPTTGITISLTTGSPTATLNIVTPNIQQGCSLAIVGHTGSLIVQSVIGTTVTFTTNAASTLNNASITTITDIPQNINFFESILDNTGYGTGNQCIYLTGLNVGRFTGNYAKRTVDYESCVYLYGSNVTNVIFQNNTLYANNNGYAIREYTVPTGSKNKFIDNLILSGGTAYNADSGVRAIA
jgi:hypothetical protein